MESSKNQSNRSGMLTGLTTLIAKLTEGIGYFAVPLSIGGTSLLDANVLYPAPIRGMVT